MDEMSSHGDRERLPPHRVDLTEVDVRTSHADALPEVWALRPQFDTQELRQALAQLCEPGEELWLVTDAATVKQVRGHHLLCITSRRLVITDPKGAVALAIPAIALSAEHPFPSEIVLTRRDNAPRSDRKLTLALQPDAAPVITDRVNSLLTGTRPAVVATNLLAPLEGLRLSSTEYLGGHGLPIQPQTPCALVISRQQMTIIAPYGARLADFPTSALTAVEFGGPGRWTKGGRMIGGGFGLLGAAEGMLIASAINALTTRSGVTTIIRLEAGDSMTAFFRHDIYTPDELQIHLSWLISQARGSSRQAALPAADADLTGQLVKLGELKTQGLLSDDEFAAAKARLLS